MKSAKEMMKVIRAELQAIKTAVQFQLAQLESESRTPAALPRAEQRPVKRPPGVEAKRSG
jgi:hypothetical protein